MFQQIRVWGPAVAWASVLFFLSARPATAFDPGWLVVPDKIAHFALYAVLGFALAHARFHGARGAPHLAFLAAGAAYGVTDEWHQAFVPGRTPSAADWLADTAGVVVGYAVATAVGTAVHERLRATSEGLR